MFSPFIFSGFFILHKEYNDNFLVYTVFVPLQILASAS